MRMKSILLAICVAFACAASLGVSGPGPGESCAREGSIWSLPNGHYVLKSGCVGLGSQVEARADHSGSKMVTLVAKFLIPQGVTLKSAAFENEATLKDYLLARYVRGIKPEIAPPGAVCGDAQTGTDTGATLFHGPPKIFIVLPNSGASKMLIGIGGTNFASGTIPYVSGVPSLPLCKITQQNVPLIGFISVGFTRVPPGAPSGPGDVAVNYFGQSSNQFPFTVN